MKKSAFRTVIFSLSCLWLVALLSAQDTAKSVEPSRRSQQELAVGLLRSINTAEQSYHYRTGAFAAWPVLLVNERRLLGNKFSMSAYPGLTESPAFDGRFANSKLTAGPQILPGWNLRLNVHADGQGYDVLLVDLTDKTCGYAALSDEAGIIRQSKTIDCEL